MELEEISDADLKTLFDSKNTTTARYWRNEIVHNFGPTNVKNIVKHTVKLNKQMHDFLEAHTQSVLGHLLP
jgi:hypothetical protein